MLTSLKLFPIVTLLGLAAALAGDKAQIACPVSGEDVDRAISVDWQGQRVYFCCKKCAAEFRKNPDPYFEKMAAAGVVLESVQTHDPVCDMAQKPEGIHADHKGRRVYFCSEYCKGEFEKSPEKFLDRLPGEHRPAS